MKIIKYIILSIFITFIAPSNIYAQNIENAAYYESNTYEYEIIPVDVGNHNSRSRSSSRKSSRSSRTRRLSNKNNKKQSIVAGVLNLLAAFLVYSIIFIIQIKFSKEKRFLRHKKNIKEDILNIDSFFSETDFLNYAQNLFINLNEAWTKRDLSHIQNFESKELFDKHNSQIREYINNGTVNYIEDIQIKNIFISNFFYDDYYMNIVVKINAKLIDYIINISNGKIVEGNKNKYWNMGYTLTFRKEIKSNLNYNYNDWILYDFKGINL